jgi:hypothetical protein
MIVTIGAAVLFTGACSAGTDRAGGAGSRTLARDTVVIDGTTPSCAQCSLEVVDSVRLGTVNDSEIPQRVPKYILRDGRGTHYLVFDGWVNKPVLRYDSRGKFLGQLGAYGEGPGEYQMTSGAMIGPGDSVFVSARQRQVFAADGSYGRSFDSDRRTLLGPVPDGSGDIYSFMNAPPMRNIPASLAARYGTAPHVFRVAPNGTLRDSFPVFSIRAGANSPVSGWSEWRVDSRPALAPDGTIWTNLGQYRLEQHAPDGTPKRLIGVTPPDGVRPTMTAGEADSLMQIARGSSPAPRQPTSRSRPGPIQIDEEGLIWLVRFVRAPGADTITIKMDYLAPNEAPQEGTIPASTQDRLYHTVVEVIDPARGELIVRATLPFNALMVRPGFIGRLRADDMDRYLVDVYRLSLRR